VTPASDPPRSVLRNSKEPAGGGEQGGSIAMKPIGQHAMLIGAGMGGRLAARAVGFLCGRHRAGARYVSAVGYSAQGRAAGPPGAQSFGARPDCPWGPIIT